MKIVKYVRLKIGRIVQNHDDTPTIMIETWNENQYNLNHLQIKVTQRVLLSFYKNPKSALIYQFNYTRAKI